MAERPGRLVYSTGARVCPDCHRVEGHCVCPARPAETVPARVTARLRLESKGRGGKQVTVVDGLPRNEAFLAAEAQALKRAMGTGGAVREGAIELQGDCRDRLRALLAERGWTVKG